VTVRAPTAGDLQTANPNGDTSATTPATVVVGQSTNPDADGSIAAVNTPINAHGSSSDLTSGSTGLPLIDLGQGSTSSGLLTSSPTGSLVNVGQGSSALGSGSASGAPLINVNQPLTASTSGPTSSPGSTTGSTVPFINLS
jgi:hypothetical protein